MSPIEQIQDQLQKLSLEKQGEVLAYVTFLQQQQTAAQAHAARSPLHQHPAFGSWGARKVDALHYQQTLRSEWDERT